MTAILRTAHLVKRFGGLLATDDVSFDLEEGHIHALIGPNGAGKSTLINQICGNMFSDGGRILLDGKDISRLSFSDRVNLGLGRTFQVTSLLGEYTVRHNLGIAVQARLGGNMRIMDSVLSRGAIWQETDALLASHPLASRHDIIVDDLSQGERKQLELLVAMAGRPKVLLLDEPMAGLGHTESQEMIEVLQKLRGKLTILMVEHDMDAVYALADRMSVLVYGKVILTGTAAEVSSNAEVRKAYLGSEGEPC